MNDAEPLPKIDIRVFEDRTGDVGEPISAALTAVRAFPFEFHGLERIDALRATARAIDAIGPAVRDQVLVASRLVRKHLLKLTVRELVDLLSHDASPLMEAA